MTRLRFSAADAVERWCDLYLGGLPIKVADDRREELLRDLYDQSTWSRERGDSERMIRRAILWRATKGLAADLAWRHRQIARLSPAAKLDLFFSSWLVIGSPAIAFVLLAFAIVGLIRDPAGSFASTNSMLTFVAALGAVCGVVLLARRRTQFIGGLWLAATTPVLATAGLELLSSSTTLLSYVSRTAPQWNVSQTLAAISLGIFYLAGAMWWSPERKTSAR